MDIPFHSQRVHHNHINKELDAIIEKTKATLDWEERKKLALESAVMAQEEQSCITHLAFDTIYGVGPRISGWAPVDSIVGVSLNLNTITMAK